MSSLSSPFILMTLLHLKCSPGSILCMKRSGSEGEHQMLLFKDIRLCSRSLIHISPLRGSATYDCFHYNYFIPSGFIPLKHWIIQADSEQLLLIKFAQYLLLNSISINHEY